MKSLRSEDVARAEQFAKRIPPHLKSDAMLANVVEQLANGAVFREASVNYIHSYMSTALKPMSQDEYEHKLAEAMTQGRGL